MQGSLNHAMFMAIQPLCQRMARQPFANRRLHGLYLFANFFRFREREKKINIQTKYFNRKQKKKKEADCPSQNKESFAE